jgi:pimeloyl-ACP methyl ester carboxylesterase
MPSLLLMLALLAPSGAARADTGRFTASGLWYDIVGRGTPVVLVHGANLDSRSMAPLARALAPSHQVILTDLRFHGRSRDEGGPFSFEGDLREVMDAAGAFRATIVGHSLGATVAVDFALAFPERVDRLVLVGPGLSGFQSQRVPEGFAEMVAAIRAGDIDSAGVILGNTPVMRLYRDTTDQERVRGIVRENARLLAADRTRVTPLGAPAAGRLAELRIPVLVVVGELDPTEAGRVGELLIENVAGARLEVIPRCGHLPPIDCSADAARLVERFVQPR